MKISFQIAGVLAGLCALGLAWPTRAATIDEEDFKALKDMVIKQGQRLDELEKSHAQDQQKIEQNQKIHEQDQQEIQRLKQQLDTTQKTASDAQQKAEAASQIQPVHPIPEGPAATHQFTMVGDAEFVFGKIDGEHSGFALADFAPIFLFRARDNILFEAGFDVTLNNGVDPITGHASGSSTSIGLSFATIDYAINDYATFVGGQMLLPLGTYSERSAGWLNWIPDDPLPRELVPPNGIGAQLRGGVPVGERGQSLAYSVYAANGPSSTDGTANSASLDFPGNVGLNSNGDFQGNLHGSPAGGGRVGWFQPFSKPHYDLEVGISGQTGPWDDAGDHSWSAAVLDYSLNLGPWVRVKGEYIYTWVETSNIGTVRPHGVWVQAGYKLAGLNLDLPVINDFEVVGRYDNLHQFLDGGTVFSKADRYTAGLIYYITNTLLLEGDYEFASSDDDSFNHNRLVFQISYGF